MHPWNASIESFYKKAKLKDIPSWFQLKVSSLMIHIYACYAILTLFNDNRTKQKKLVLCLSQFF